MGSSNRVASQDGIIALTPGKSPAETTRSLVDQGVVRDECRRDRRLRIDVMCSIAEGSASDGIQDPVGRASTVDDDRAAPTEGIEGDRVGDVHLCALDVSVRWMVDR